MNLGTEMAVNGATRIPIFEFDNDEFPSHQWLRDRFREQRVFVLRSQRALSADELLNIGRFCGPVYTNKNADVFKVNAEGSILRVSNATDAGQPTGLFGDHDLEWHNDFAHTPGSFHGALIYNRRNGELADTLFCDMRQVFLDLPEEIRQELRATTGYHAVTEKAYRDLRIADRHMERLRGRNFRMKRLNFSQDCVHDLPTSRPLVPNHPFRLGEALYLSFATLVGTEPSISRNLLNQLRERCEDSRYTFRHTWCSYDILIFDNLSVMHRRPSFAGDRELWRIQFDYSEMMKVN